MSLKCEQRWKGKVVPSKTHCFELREIEKKTVKNVNALEEGRPFRSFFGKEEIEDSKSCDRTKLKRVFEEEIERLREFEKPQ